MLPMRLFSNRSQMMSKCGKSKKGAHKAIAECVTDVPDATGNKRETNVTNVILHRHSLRKKDCHKSQKNI